MNSDNLIDFVKKITYPIDSNKYISGALLIILLVNTQHFLPQPLLPNILINELKKYGLLSFIFTLLFSYLLTKDINVSIIVSLLIFGLNYVNLKIENLQNTSTSILINEFDYNLNLDGVIQKDNTKIIISDHNKVLLDVKPTLPIINTTKNLKKRYISDKIHVNDNNFNFNSDTFDFNKDTLKYLDYESQNK